MRKMIALHFNRDGDGILHIFVVKSGAHGIINLREEKQKAGDIEMSKMREQEQINIITKEIVDEVIQLLQDNVYKIVLYGSYARGDFTKESDIDILILLNCTKEQVMQYRKQISRLSSRIGLNNDIEISLLLRDRETFEKGKNILPFYQNIKKEGVEIYG